MIMIMKMKVILKIIPLFSLILLISCGQCGNTNKPSDTGTSQISEMKTGARVKNALSFINGYVENANKMKQSMDIVDWVNSNNLSTKGFKKELKRLIDEAYKQNPDLGLDADPVFDAQDYPDKGFDIESFDEKTNYLTVRGIDRPGFKLMIKIVNENGNWLVDGCGMINIPENKRAKR